MVCDFPAVLCLQLFFAIKHQVRSILKLLRLCSHRRIVDDNDDVQFCWLIASADFEIDNGETRDMLLNKIVELYLTVRGFHYLE